MCKRRNLPASRNSGAPRRARKLAYVIGLALLASASVPATVPFSTAAFAQQGYAYGPALAPTRPAGAFDIGADGAAHPAGVGHSPPARLSTPAAITLSPSPEIQMGDDAATLMADRLVLTGPRSMTAEGAVAIWYHGRRLIASRVVYDGASDRVIVEGPIYLSTPADRGTDREAVLIADDAELNQELTDGILRGARLVLARQMQMAANEARLEGEGRFVVLDHVVASSCQVCRLDPTPLWEIRARSITHDRETRRLLFDRPHLRAFGVPVAALPWLSAPDPTVDRMNGFLTPRFRTTSGLGPGVKLPYFITLGDSADLTLTPYLATSHTKTLEARYRQALRNGEVMLTGAVSRDDLADGTRGYLFGTGRFDLPRGWRLDTQLQAASSRAYLLDYGITDADRLWSGMTLSRVRRNDLALARVGTYRTLREDEDRATTPAQVADILWQRRLQPSAIGGEAVLEWSAHAHRRPSRSDQTGRDMARASFGASWSRSDVLTGGMLVETAARMNADFYRIVQDSRYDATRMRVTPAASVTLRWPLLRQEEGGATQLLEPIVQLAWSPRMRGLDDIPNEDSVLWEFDEGNLFSLSRYPGHDARESGLRANIGLGWTRFDPDGWSLALAAGRVIRHETQDMPSAAPVPDFGKLRSNWLLSANFANDAGMAFAGRALINDSASITRAELRAGLARPNAQLAAGYLWIDGDAEPGRGNDISELVFETGMQLSPGWWATGEARYDFSADRAQKAALGLTYRNECVTVDMGVERRFVRGNSLRPETSFDLSVRLGGFGQPGARTMPGTVARRSCLR